MLIDYFSNMVYTLELLLKVMSDDWREPGKSRFGHNVGAMYREVFGKDHPSPDFMAALRSAIVNQKFIYEPADGLIGRVPQIEALWAEVTQACYDKHLMQQTAVHRDVTLSSEQVAHLRAILPEIYEPEGLDARPRKSRGDTIKKLESQIALLSDRLAQLRAGDDFPEETPQEFIERQRGEFIQGIRQAISGFDINVEERGGEISFGTWSAGVVVPGSLG